MKFITNRFGLKKLAAAVLGICVLAPVAQAHDKDHVDFGVSADNHGDVGLDLSFSDHDHHPHDRVEHVWVDAVWRNDGTKVWVDPVWEKVADRVFVPPVTKDVCTRVWVDPVVEDRQVVSYSHGHKLVVHTKVEVSPGHYEDQHTSVVVADGHYDTSEHWVMRSDGHYEVHDNWVLVSDGHYEDRVVVAHPVHPVVEEKRVDIRFGGH